MDVFERAVDAAAVEFWSRQRGLGFIRAGLNRRDSVSIEFFRDIRHKCLIPDAFKKR